ncbi:unnamed protein product, partial [Brenthis ino]
MKVKYMLRSSRTVATYTDGSSKVELTSDAVTRLIGQKKYDTLFTALCSIINPELRVEAILSLLTSVNQVSVETQSYLSYSTQIKKQKVLKSKIKRKTVTTYPVPDYIAAEGELKKVVIDPKNVKLIEPENIKREISECVSNESIGQLRDISDLLDDSSNISGASFGSLSIGSLSNISLSKLNIDIFTDPKPNNNEHAEGTISNEKTSITMLDGSIINIKGNPDIFHIASSEILKDLSPEERKKIICHQAYIDWIFCVQRDDDGYLPLHRAVLNKDIELLKRQCAMLKTRNVCIDAVADGNMTALQMGIQMNLGFDGVSILLEHGADPMVLDEKSRNCFHLAAEVSSENVQALIEYCTKNARQILKEDDSYTFEMEKKSDEELASQLLNTILSSYDTQGYTPLMIASKQGKYENAKLLIKAGPKTVDIKMPTSGDTALYLAVTSACIQSRDSNNRTKVAPEFIETVKVLVQNGAHPSTENLAGNSVNSLLSENYIKDLSLAIAYEYISINSIDLTEQKKLGDFILLKTENGDIKVEKLRNDKEESISEVPNIKKVIKKQNENESKASSSKQIVSKTVDEVKPLKVMTKPSMVILKKPIKLSVNKGSLPIILSKTQIKRIPNVPTKRESEDKSEDGVNKKCKN